MGEHAAWANLEDPIYAEKDLEVFRPAPKQSTLPVYFIKGWLPVSADTLFNALMDAKFRTAWDTNIKEVSVVDRKEDGDIMYAAVNLPWPLSDRDYVYHRRAKFFPNQHAFVVICQSAHHSSAPEYNGLVRVETYALRLCIRASTDSNDACDFHAEYEDDTDFSIPNYGINFMLHTMLPSFMNNLRVACAEYANYIKKLDDNDIQGIPSQVLRYRSEKNRSNSATGTGSSGNLSDSQISSNPSKSRSSPRKLFRKSRGLFLSRKRRSIVRHHSDSDDNYSVYSEPGSARVSSVTARNALLPARRALRKSISMNSSPLSPQVSITSASASSSVHSKALSRRGRSTQVDDFVVEFHKQKIGLHLEMDLFSNNVVVAYCEKDSEADKANYVVETGLIVTSMNGVPVSSFKFNEILGEIKKASRPLTLGFTYPPKQSPGNRYRRLKESKSVMKCLVTRDEHNLLRALRPLNEVASTSAVLKHDFNAPAYSKKLHRSSSPVGIGAKNSNVEYVILPEGYILYEIDGCYASDLTFAEIAHLLHRNNEMRVVSFKPALAVNGDRSAECDSRSSLSKRLSGAFRWRDLSFDEGSATNSTVSSSPPVSSSSTPNGSSRNNSPGSNTVTKGSGKQNCERKRVDVTPSKSASDTTWRDAIPSVCLDNYSAVTITAKNVSWAWEHVHLLKADERIFSAALLIDKIEAFIAKSRSNGVECAAAEAVRNAMINASDFISRIKERQDAGTKVLAEFSSEEGEDGWEFGQSHFGVTTYWKPADDGSVWLKMEGVIEGVDVFNTVAVLREMDLWSLWFPFCNQSTVLRQTGHVDYLTYMCISSPVLQRDALLEVCAINACYERRCVLMMGNTIDASKLSSSIEVPTCKGWNSGRMDINGLRAIVEPLSRTKSRTCIVANIDPKCAIPKPLLNFGIKKMAGILLFLLRKEAEKIEKAQQDDTKNDHLSRMERDPTQFYGWLRPLVDKFLDDQKCGMLPDLMSLELPDAKNLPCDVAQESECPQRKQSSRALLARKCSRTAAFHREMHAVSTRADHSTLVPTRLWRDYVYDFGIWPYLLLLLAFSDVSVEKPFLQVCAFKFLFTCLCTYFGVPGAFSWQTRQRKRERNELGALRRRFVVLAGILDVANSWAMRAWVHWLECYAALVVQRARAPECFARSPAEVREAENFWLTASAFVFATAVVCVQVVVNI